MSSGATSITAIPAISRTRQSAIPSSLILRSASAIRSRSARRIGALYGIRVARQGEAGAFQVGSPSSFERVSDFHFQSDRMMFTLIVLAIE